MSVSLQLYFNFYMGQNMKSDWIFALWLQVCTTSNRTANPGAHKNVTCRLYVTTPPVTCGLCNVISNGIIPILELSLNSMGVLVGSWLFCTQHFPCLVSFRCMLGVGVGA